MKSLSRVGILAIPWTAAHQAPPSMGFSRQEYWSGVSGFPYFLQFKSEFCNKEFMIWVTVSSKSCFCWLYRASPSSAANWPSGDPRIGFWDFPVVQWTRIFLPMHGTRVQSLVWEDSTCFGATKPMSCNYWSLPALEPMLHNQRSQSSEKPTHRN